MEARVTVDEQLARALRQPHQLDGQAGPQPVAGQHQQRHAADRPVGIGRHREGAEALRGVGERWGGPQGAVRAPQSGQSWRRAQQDWNRGQVLSGGAVFENVTQRGRRFRERGGQRGIAVRQLGWGKAVRGRRAGCRCRAPPALPPRRPRRCAPAAHGARATHRNGRPRHDRCRRSRSLRSGRRCGGATGRARAHAGRRAEGRATTTTPPAARRARRNQASPTAGGGGELPSHRAAAGD